MNIMPDFQFIMIITAILVFLFTAIAVIFYRLGKREKAKILDEYNKITKKENEINPRQIELPETPKELKEESKIETANSNPVENGLAEKKSISLQELYSKKIEEEVNNTKADDISESEKLSDFKFLKYTSNGYKPAKGDKESRVLRWR